jgi:hypothetical protein
MSQLVGADHPPVDRQVKARCDADAGSVARGSAAARIVAVDR